MNPPIFLRRYGYCRDFNSSGAEEATPPDWAWLHAKYGEEGPYGDSPSGGN